MEDYMKKIVVFMLAAVAITFLMQSFLWKGTKTATLFDSFTLNVS
jgi:hypothetical protein